MSAPGEKETFVQEAGGSAIAAFTLSQIAFWQIVQHGLLEQAEAERLLDEAITANKKAGPINQIAAQKLAQVLTNLKGTKTSTAKK